VPTIAAKPATRAYPALYGEIFLKGIPKAAPSIVIAASFA